jgi:hypothetical protein
VKRNESPGRQSLKRHKVSFPDILFPPLEPNQNIITPIIHTHPKIKGTNDARSNIQRARSAERVRIHFLTRVLSFLACEHVVVP